jgi:hypothetical protein
VEVEVEVEVEGKPRVPYSKNLLLLHHPLLLHLIALKLA